MIEEDVDGGGYLLSKMKCVVSVASLMADGSSSSNVTLSLSS